MKGLLLLSVDEVIEVNRRLGYSVLNRSSLDFIYSKIRSIRFSGDMKDNVSKIASILWYELIRNHPFYDGNKRTAAESMLLFIESNDYRLNVPPNGVIYLSLKIANNDITLDELNKEVCKRLEEIK